MKTNLAGRYLQNGVALFLVMAYLSLCSGCVPSKERADGGPPSLKTYGGPPAAAKVDPSKIRK